MGIFDSRQVNKTMFSEKERKELFPITKECLYFNHAAVGPFPKYVRESADLYISRASTMGDAHWDATLPLLRDLRGKIGTLIGSKMSDVAFTRNVSEGISILASGFPWKPGENVVIPKREFPANVYPWLNLERVGVEIKFAELTDGCFGVKELEKCVDENTRIISISSVQFFHGFRADLKEIGAFCKSHGVLFCVDAIQHLGALPLDVKDAQIDFLACGGHKWLMGSEGIGFVACRKDLAETLFPGSIGWMGVKQWTNFFDIRMDFKPGALRFETGTCSAFGLYCLNASIAFFLEKGVHNLAAMIERNSRHLISKIEENGWDLTTPKTGELSGIVTFKIPEKDSDVVVAKLQEQKIHIAGRQGTIRISPHFYNTIEELDILVQKLKELA